MRYMITAKMIAYESALKLAERLGMGQDGLKHEWPQPQTTKGDIISETIELTNEQLFLPIGTVSEDVVQPAITKMADKIGNRRVCHAIDLPAHLLASGVGSVITYCGLMVRVIPVYDGVSEIARYMISTCVEPKETAP